MLQTVRRGSSWFPLAALCCALVSPLSLAQARQRYFGLQVRDVDGGALLPGVQLETTNKLVLTTDLFGTAAFYEPGLMTDDVWFSVRHPLYEHAKDFLGNRGKAVSMSLDGGLATFYVTRIFDGGVAPVVTTAEEFVSLANGVPRPGEFFSIRVVDSQTGRGVPMVQLRTDGGSYLTDSAGYIAFFERLRMGTPTPFTVFSHGYHYADGGALLTPTDGGKVVLSITRDNVAERLYRITGQGIYRESTLLGLPSPLSKPNINGRVMGSDSSLSTLYQGRPFFAWGDTGQPSYPLGNFYATGARSKMPDAGGLAPEVGIDLEYFTVPATGFVKGIAPQSDAGNGPVWLGGVWALRDDAGTERLYATFSKVKGFTALYSGIMRFDDAAGQFVRIAVYDAGQPIEPRDVPVQWTDADGTWFHFDTGVRVKADINAMLRFDGPNGYQSYTAVLRDGGTQRDALGRAVFAWRPSTPPLAEYAARDGQVDAGEGLWETARDIDTTAVIFKHTSMAPSWNAYRQRFVRIIQQWFGSTSLLGELFYGEADSPLGPWVWHKKVITHSDYTFYNPRHHAFFDQDGGQIIYFEGTYTDFLTGAVPTPRYDYNQLMYRLNLADERLVLPVPTYRVGESFRVKQALPPGVPDQVAPFLAWDRYKSGLVPVWRDGTPCAPGQWKSSAPAVRAPAFWALPLGFDADAGELLQVGACVQSDGGERLALQGEGPCTDFRALANVRTNPLSVALPVDPYLRSPLAYAGESRCVRTAGVSASVPLTGMASRVFGSTISNYSWATPSGTLSGAEVTPTLPLGVQTIELTVVAANGRSDKASIEVEVAAVIPDDGGQPLPADGGDGGEVATDAGSDSGTGDAGSGDAGAARDGGDGGMSVTEVPPDGCGCHGGGAPWALGTLLVIAVRRKSNRVRAP